MSESVFLVAFVIAASTVVLSIKMIASAFSSRRGGAELGQIRDQLDQQAAALEDAQQHMASQGTQIAELQERVDFAERMLAQNRERSALKPGEPQA